MLRLPPQPALGLAGLALALAACAPMGMSPAAAPAGLAGAIAAAGTAPYAAPAATPVAVSTPAATFALKNKPWPQIGFQELEGKARDIAEFKGRSVLLVFFAYWCPHCQVELPRLQQQIAERKPANFACVPIEASAGTPAQVREFAAQFQVTMPLYVDPTGESYRAFNVRSYPTVFRLAADGTVQDTMTGELQPQDYPRFIN